MRWGQVVSSLHCRHQHCSAAGLLTLLNPPLISIAWFIYYDMNTIGSIKFVYITFLNPVCKPHLIIIRSGLFLTIPWTAPSSSFSASTDMTEWEVGTNLIRPTVYHYTGYHSLTWRRRPELSWSPGQTDDMLTRNSTSSVRSCLASKTKSILILIRLRPLCFHEWSITTSHSRPSSGLASGQKYIW